MAQFVENIQIRLKNSSSGLVTLAIRLLSGLVIGLTFALVGQEMLGYGNLSFTLVITAVLAVFLRMSRGWGLARVVVFDFICVLVGMLLRMYILIAPGA